MRFLFYDRIVELRKMESIIGVKCFSLSEEFHRGHFGKIALVPGVILIEAMAQLLGWLINYSHDFTVLSIMSMIDRAEVPADLRPGMDGCIHGEIISTSDKDSLGRAWIEVGGKTVARIERIIYSHFHETDPVVMERLFRYYSGLKDF